MVFKLTPKLIFKFLFACVIVLTFLNLVGIAFTTLGRGELMGLIPMFDFDRERNVPTLYSSANLMLSAVILGLIAVTHKANGATWVPWLGLSAIFVFLSVDELARIHEKLTAPLQLALSTSGAFYYAWTIPYGILTGILFLSYFRFLMRLPAKTRYLFIAAGAIFISGAIGFEMIGSFQLQNDFSRNTLATRLTYTCEEFLEMVGVVVFIYALLDYVLLAFGSLSIQMDQETLPKKTSDSAIDHERYSNM